MHRIDQGHKVLDEISKTYGEHQLANANEAETRLKLIDQVITQVLGWEREDLSVEERVTEDGSTQFADYILHTASTAILIESKKVGVAFTLPSNRLTLELGGVLSEGPVGKAIRQARDYCRKKSVPFATVTNGSVWIVFPAVRTDQVTFENSTAHIFRSLNDIRKRFVEFWELLSKERVLDGNIASVLLGVCAAGQFRKVGERENIAEGLFQGVLWSRFGPHRVSRRLLAPRIGGGGPSWFSLLGRNPSLQAAISTLILLMLRARHTKSHSPLTDCKPRRLNRLNPSPCLIQP